MATASTCYLKTAMLAVPTISMLLCRVAHCRQGRRADLEQQHGVSWAVGSAALKEAVAELCLYNVVALQASLAALSARFVFSKWLQEHIGQQRQQHRKLDSHLDTIRTKMDAKVTQLLAWVPWLRHHQQHMRDASLRAHLQATSVALDFSGKDGSIWWCSCIKFHQLRIISSDRLVSIHGYKQCRCL